MFGEDPKKTTPDEFFGVFDQFISSLNHSAGQNRRRQKIKEEEAKRIKIENQVRFRMKARFIVDDTNNQHILVVLI